MSDDDRSLQQVHAQFMQRRIRTMANQLRHLADSFDRAANTVETVGQKCGPRTYTQIAVDVQHEALWGLANLHLDGLATGALDADAVRTQAATAEKIAKAIEAAGTLDGDRWQEAGAQIARKHGEG